MTGRLPVTAAAVSFGVSDNEMPRGRDFLSPSLKISEYVTRHTMVSIFGFIQSQAAKKSKKCLLRVDFSENHDLLSNLGVRPRRFAFPQLGRNAGDDFTSGAGRMAYSGNIAPAAVQTGE